MKIINYILSLKPEILFSVIALFFGTFSAFAVQQLSVNDEGVHLLRSYTISTGNITSDTCSYPQEIIDKVKESYQKNYSFNLSEKNSHSVNAFDCGTADSYYPLMHLPQSIGISISKVIYDSPAFMVLLGRLANLLFFVASMYLIIRFVPIGKWVFFVLGLLPITIHAASSLSYDTFNTVVLFSLIAIVLTFFGQKKALSKKQLILLVLFSLLASMAKSSNTLVLLLMFALPLRLFKYQRAKFSPIANKLMIIFGILILSLLSIVIWQKVSGSSITEVSMENHLSNNPLYIVVILYNTYINPFFGYTDIFVRGVVGEFSSFQYHLPTYLVILSFGLITFSLLLKNDFEQKYLKFKGGTLAAVALSAFVLSFLLITYVMYTIWATQPIRQGPHAIYADGVQGRYFTALLALFIPIGIWLRRYITVETSSSKVSTAIILLGSLFLLFFYSAESLMQIY